MLSETEFILLQQWKLMFIMQKGTYLSFHYFADVSGNKTKNQTMSAVLRQNDFHLT